MLAEESQLAADAAVEKAIADCKALFKMESSFKMKTDLVYAHLRELIITGQLRPGDRLVQQDVAEALNVSATPVREALGRMSAEGILTRVPHHGAQLAHPTAKVVDEIYRVRSILEAMAVAEAIDHLNEEAIACLQELAEQMPRLMEEGQRTKNLVPLRLANYIFHRSLYAFSQMVVVPTLLDNLWARSMIPDSFYQFDPVRSQTAMEEHLQIVKMIKEKNVGRAQQLLQEHVDHNRRSYVHYLGLLESEQKQRLDPSADGG